MILLLGFINFEPKMNPAPTPNVPKTPGSSQPLRVRGLKIYDAVATKSPPSATIISF